MRALVTLAFISIASTAGAQCKNSNEPGRQDLNVKDENNLVTVHAANISSFMGQQTITFCITNHSDKPLQVFAEASVSTTKGEVIALAKIDDVIKADITIRTGWTEGFAYIFDDGAIAKHGRILSISEMRVWTYQEITPVPIGVFMVANQKSRLHDRHGSGQYAAPRDKGTRTHEGIDIISTAGENVFAPFEGTIIRESVPYENDPSYRGILMAGSGKWSGYRMKIFYVEGIFAGKVRAGGIIGKAQDLKLKYPSITNHIHVEVTKKGKQIDPLEIWQMSF
jgi:hypothetical protein